MINVFFNFKRTAFVNLILHIFLTTFKRIVANWTKTLFFASYVLKMNYASHVPISKIFNLANLLK